MIEKRKNMCFFSNFTMAFEYAMHITKIKKKYDEEGMMSSLTEYITRSQ